jgi:hypothetical protein
MAYMAQSNLLCVRTRPGMHGSLLASKGNCQEGISAGAYGSKTTRRPAVLGIIGSAEEIWYHLGGSAYGWHNGGSDSQLVYTGR